MKTLKSIGAVLAGILSTFLVTTAVDVALQRVHFYPGMTQPISDGQALAATTYRIVISIAGACLSAKLAPDRPLLHAIMFGCVGTILGLLGVVATWDKNLGPRWYPIVLALLALPQCLVGGKLYLRGSNARVTTA